MPDDWKVHIEDMIECMERATGYARSTTFEVFEEDRMLLDAIERNFITIGEAARRIPDDLRESNPDVPWSAMRGMRNVATHRYFGMDTKTVWRTAKHNLPTLAPKLRRILEGEG